MKILSEYKKEIGISLGTGIILICTQPLFDFFGNFIVKTFISINENYSNQYYKAIAINNEQEFSQKNSLILNVFFTYALIGILLYIYVLINRLNKDVKKGLLDINKKKLSLENKSDEQISKEELLSKLKKNEVAFLGMEKRSFKNKIMFLTTLVLTALLAIIIFTKYAFNTSVAKQNLTFKNDLIKIAPYIDEITIIKIRSNWAQIENNKDFEVAQSKIDSIKKVYKIK